MKTHISNIPSALASALLALLLCAGTTSCNPVLAPDVPDPSGTEEPEPEPQPEDFLAVSLATTYVAFRDGDDALSVHFTVESSNPDSLSVAMSGEKGFLGVEMTLSADRLSGDLTFSRTSVQLFQETFGLIFSNGRTSFVKTFTAAYSAFLWDDGSVVREIDACGLESSFTLALMRDYEYDVECPHDWITVTERTKSGLTVALSEHNAYEGREGDIVLVNRADGMSVSCHVVQDHTDKLALLALYEALDGPNWVKQVNWSESLPFSRFSGIADRDGRVTSIRMINNHMKGELPEEFFTMDMLEEIELTSFRWIASTDVVFGIDYRDLWNDIRGEFRASCFPRLKKVYLGGNMHMTGSIEEFWDLPLEVLDVANCSFTGALSDGIGRLAELRELYVSDNKLSGRISNEMTRLDKLRNIYLGNGLHEPNNIGNRPEWRGERRNEFEGGLPEDLGKMKSLRQLHAEWVGLSGEIPKSIFESETLEYVRIVFNEFSGTLEPEWFEGMTSLDSFYCWDNPKLFIRGYCPSNVYFTSSQILSE